MKKSTKVIAFLAGALIMIILITRPYEPNYNLDEEKGIENVIDKIKELAENDSVYEFYIETQCEQRDMDFLTLCMENPESKMRTQIFLNRGGAFSNSVDREETDGKNYAKLKYYDVSNLSESLALIEDCKKLVPKSYNFRHTEYIAVQSGRISIIKIAVAPQDENNIEKNTYVHLKTYSKDSYSGRRAKKNTKTYSYYVMEFTIDEDGKISID